MSQLYRKTPKAGSKSWKLPGAASRKAKRQRSHAQLVKKNDRRVARSSHGKFSSVAELLAHREKVARKAA